jgi:hypothetical protein
MTQQMVLTREEDQRRLEAKLIELRDAREQFKEKNFVEGRWKCLPEEGQGRIREFKYTIQFFIELYLAKWGTEEQRLKLMPLVFRRDFLQTGEDAWRYGLSQDRNSFLEDGKLWTFDKEPRKVAVKVDKCTCGENHTEQEVLNGECPRTIEVTEMVDGFHTKHSKGNWNCAGCLNAQIRDETTASYVRNKSGREEDEVGKFVKATKWCPNFLVGMSYDGVSNYAEFVRQETGEMRNANLCYAGIVHIEMEPGEDEVTIRQKCDTCGWSLMETKKVARQVIGE